MLEAERAKRRGDGRRRRHEPKLLAHQQTDERRGRLERRVRVEDQRHSYARAVRPARRACDFGEDIGTARTPRREREHVLFRHFRVHEELFDDVRMRIAEKTLRHRAIGAARERLSLSQRERSAATIIRHAIIVRIRHAPQRRRRGGARLPKEPLEREMWNADRFLAKALHGSFELRILKRIDEGDERFTRGRLRLLGPGAEDVERVRHGPKVPVAHDRYEIGDAELGFRDRTNRTNDRVGAAQNPGVHRLTEALGAAVAEGLGAAVGAATTTVAVGLVPACGLIGTGTPAFATGGSRATSDVADAGAGGGTATLSEAAGDDGGAADATPP
jgi:hypothetical protein